MNATSMPAQRSRPIYALAILLVIGAGLLWRSGLFPLSDFMTKYGGDALWALMVFLSLGMVFYRSNTTRIAGGAVALAWGVEFLQLYHAPWIDGLRAMPLGRLALGTSFNTPDLLAYVIGIMLGALGERMAFKPKQKT